MKTKTTTTGRRPKNFVRGRRLPNRGIDFILSLSKIGTDLRQIQKNYHTEFGVWVTENRINSVISGRLVKTNSEETNVVSENFPERPVLVVKYKGNYYTFSEFGDLYARETVKYLLSGIEI